MTKVKVLKASDLPPGEMKKVEIGNRTLCVAHIEGHGFRAIDDRCTHEDESLSDGWICGDSVECPAHSSRFSFLTGEVTGVPAWIPVKVYDVQVDNDAIYVTIDDVEAASA
ncbi:non-heme iron oxygenase ferredoxin subunit [Sphingobium sp. 10 DY56-G10]|jgi:3-phenylpropionate/trans-cinnamate dioxygenase ferredoxin component|uniref:Rieske (2Fe-2S) protein n=1 Tax=Sphingobium sp. 10 DY56-G10 TaxID=2974918 RepID=UPI00352B5023